jgi:hypothetical protein
MKAYLPIAMLVAVLSVLGGCGGGSAPLPRSHPVITSAPPPAGTVGVPYGYAQDASGGVQPYNWSWAPASGSTLPPGLIFSNAGISGQPTTAGTFNVVLTITDSQSPPAHASANYAITIAPMAQLAITSGNPPNGVAGQMYGHASCGIHNTCLYGFPLGATGGIQPYGWSWTGAPGSTTPPGLSIQTSGKCGSGTFSGGARIICIPKTAGTYKVVITVKDSASPPNQVSANYTIQIDNPPPPSIVTFPLPQGAAINLMYSFTFTENNGLYPVTWTETGTLPPGLSLSPYGPDEVLSGTPTATGTFPITLMITDAVGQTSAPQDFTIVVAAHGFKVTGNMTASRIYHDAALLQDGRVLVTGGEYGGTVVSSAELYDPTARTFSATGKMAATRACHTLTSLKDGRVLVAGGFDGNGAALSTAEIFDPAKGTFAPTGKLAAARGCHTAILLKDGRVLIVAGFDGNVAPQATAELFDPTNGSFSSTAGLMTSARVFHTATLLQDGRVLVTGGIAPSFTGVASAELFDPATGLFSPTMGDMGTARLGHTATLLFNGKVLIAGGSVTVGAGSALATAEIFDPATETFANTGSMGMARTLHTATPLNDGTVLVAGGDPDDLVNIGGSSYGWAPSPLASAEFYDPVSGTFTETGGLITARENHTATLLNDGTVLITGGFWYSPTPETYQ